MGITTLNSPPLLRNYLLPPQLFLWDSKSGGRVPVWQPQSHSTWNQPRPRAGWERHLLSGGSIFLTSLPIGMFELKWISSWKLLSKCGTSLGSWTFLEPVKFLEGLASRCLTHKNGLCFWRFPHVIQMGVGSWSVLPYAQVWSVCEPVVPAHDYHTMMWVHPWVSYDPACPI